MSSLVMHLAVSNIIKEKYNLSNAFLAGSIMPDIYGKCKVPWDLTHFVTTEKINPDILRFPNIPYFINKHGNKLTNEIMLGYLCHLIEDRVWFKQFISKYVKVASYVDNIKNNIQKYYSEDYTKKHLMNNYTNVI